MVDSSWIFHSQLPFTHFSSSFFANYCHLISFFKKPQNCNVTNFCIISNFFPHKYNDTNFRIGNKKLVSPRNQSHPAKPISPREINLSPRETNPSPRETNPSSRETNLSPRETNLSPRETNLPPRNQPPPAKPISPRNQSQVLQS